MCKKLREVTFRLNYQQGFQPDLTEEQVKELEEQERERHGYFHEWASVKDNDEKTCFHINKLGIVEEKGTGKVYTVFPELIIFKDSPVCEKI